MGEACSVPHHSPGGHQCIHRNAATENLEVVNCPSDLNAPCTSMFCRDGLIDMQEFEALLDREVSTYKKHTEAGCVIS